MLIDTNVVSLNIRSLLAKANYCYQLLSSYYLQLRLILNEQAFTPTHPLENHISTYPISHNKFCTTNKRSLPSETAIT